MESPLTRRRLIQAGGVGAALSLAGCSSLDMPKLETSEGESSGQVTVLAGFDETRLQAFRKDVEKRVESAEIDREEAEARIRQKEVELLAAAVETFESRIRGVDDLSVTKSDPESGVLLVEGSATSLLGTLELTEVRGLLSEQAYEAVRQESRQGS